MLSCYQFIPHSAVFSADTNTRSIASTVASLVLPTLFILHTNCCGSCILVSRYAHFCTRHINLHKQMMQPPTPVKAYSMTKPTNNMNHRWIFPRRWCSFTRRICFGCCKATSKRSITCFECYCDIHEPTIYLRVDNIANTLRICLNWFG